ncbi:1-acyl-sn-glycerol-3-phosphate acyltransferase [Wenzhouxiangella sp. AB-CW3]|uniref:lysophospholipid acyltransferase family protein n=1 Tax=Wenzhouxiangella sp. AB-CW3 TaxID=2771012 RepID=UPI00168AF996|nr:lysophospholipid acyltransferase family protein [Wenzhouxiangella sp. AB-CW3]QOC21147.1 1-acyl-sn-glycerol-3-phosphate acyltransferase [Wenzhouxiangella sp. AB-CW3]
MTSAPASFLSRLYPIWMWLVYVPLAALTTLVSAVLAVPLALLVSPRLANRCIAANWGRMLAWLVPVRVSVEGLDGVDPSRSYVVVANHQSQFDIPVVYGFSGLDLRWVAKAEVGRIPFVAAGCRAIGHVFINRSDPDQARTAINRAVERLKPGTGLMFFPEGTRSRSGELMRFKKGAFRVAIDQQLPLLPVSVIGSRDILPADSLRLRPGRVRLRFHAPIDTTGMSAADVGDLRRQAHEIIAEGLRTGHEA